MKRTAKLIPPVIALFVGFCAAGQSVTNTDNGNAAHMTNSQATNATSNVSAKTNAVGDEAYSKKFINPETGQCAFVGLDKLTVTLKDKNGNVIWTKNLAEVKQTDGAGDVFTDIRSVEFIEKPPIVAVWGENDLVFCSLDVHTGKVIEVGRRMHLP